ncbi:stress response translation initiation inhibitor YciH [bacterium]|nr:stress response translation initiation inhibitor YciH [bacterium]HPF34301.1 stress response translation initiation inhibitor YciH [Candidatus Krumholzibacteria bacterium]HRX49920.1 stress response translation initiation inhibitor YciH [Candidatus Krumholzibacteria bacterium]
MPRDTRRVYSTDGGRVDSQPAREAPTPAGDGVVRVSRQTQGRKGRGVTVITGIPLAGEALKDLARELKQRCGSGGTVRDGVVEIQGDHRDALVPVLEARGWRVKRAGG